MTDALPFKKLSLTRKFFLKSLHVSPTCRAVYVNNPKVACSTIKLALQRGELKDPSYAPKRSVHDYDGSPLLTWPNLDIEKISGMLSDNFTFSFVRCPYRRLQSAYVNKILRRQKNGQPRLQAGFGDREKPTFSAFIEAISVQNPVEHNPHWRPQWINLSIDVVPYDFMGRLETFQEDWPQLADRLGLDVQPERAGKTTDPAQAAYTRESAALVAQVYARDFEAFGYDPDKAPHLGT